MKKRFLVVISAVALVAVSASWGYTNPIENQSIEIVDQGAWYPAGDLFVGQATHGNGLIVSGSGRIWPQRGTETGSNLMASNNWISVSGSNSNMRTVFMRIGNEGSGNSLTIYNGGFVNSGNTSLGVGSNAIGNWATVSGSYTEWRTALLEVGAAGSGNLLSIYDGGRVVSSSGYVGRHAGSDNNMAVVSGPGATWKIGGDLFVGYEGSTNSLWIIDGGVVSSEEAYIGYADESRANLAIVTGLGSAWSSSNIVLRGGAGNNLTIADNGYVSTTNFQNNARLLFESGGRISTRTYGQASGSVLSFRDISSGPLILASSSADFETGAIIEFSGSASDLDPDQALSQLLVDSRGLLIGGPGPPDVNDLQISTADLGTLFEMRLTAPRGLRLYANLLRRSISSSAGFEQSSDMSRMCNEIDAMYSGRDPTAVQQWNRYNTFSGARQRSELQQLYDRGTPNYQHSQGMVSGAKQTLSRADGLLAGRGGPVGAAGPDNADQPIQGWIKVYGGRGVHDGSAGLSGYDLDMFGTVIGFDKLFGNLLIGIAGGYAKSDLSQVDGDCSKGETGYGIIYVSRGSEAWFGDLSISHGITQIETSSGTGSGAKGRVNADSFAFYAGGGKEIGLSEGRYIITPEASLQIAYYGQGGYTETSPASVPRTIEAYERWSYLSALGAAFAYQKEFSKVVLRPELRAFWLHEFNAESDDVGYSLVGGTGKYSFKMLPPEEDTLEFGIGIAARFNDRLDLAFDIDGRFSRNYQDLLLSGRLVYEF